MDLTAPEMRTLIDFGLKPWTRSQNLPVPNKVSDPLRTRSSTEPSEDAGDLNRGPFDPAPRRWNAPLGQPSGQPGEACHAGCL
jgi:hypothetical protein